MIELSQNGWPYSTPPCKTAPPENSIGIVIPVKDGLKFFKLCLHSVLYFTDHPYMLSIVDNQSGLRTKKYLLSITQNHAINVLRFDEEYNFAAEVNMGLRHVFSFPGIRYGLILNADCVVEPAWLSKLVDSFSKDMNIGIVGPVSNYANAEQVGTRKNELITNVPRVSGFCMLVRKEAFESVGGFDEDFTGGGFEDWDFCERARIMGWFSAINSSVYIHHFGSMFRRGEQYRETMRKNEKLFFKKHPKLELLLTKQET